MHILNANIISHPQGDKKSRQTHVFTFLKGLTSLSQFYVGYIFLNNITGWLRLSASRILNDYRTLIITEIHTAFSILWQRLF